MSTGDDLEAIDGFFRRSVAASGPPTATVQAIYDNWRKWYDCLSWYDKNIAGGVLDSAKSQRDSMNRALGATDFVAEGWNVITDKGVVPLNEPRIAATTL